MRYPEPTRTTQLEWGQIALLVLLGAVSAVFKPTLLLLAGGLRLVWCMCGGRLGRGFLDLVLFGLLYAVVALAPELSHETQRAPEQSSPVADQ